jgi:hypothetical protein
MNYRANNKEIAIKISASNHGKFRFKTRDNNISFGHTFSTRNNNFTEKTYLEWQIGYDATTTDVKNGKKKTNLKKRTFIGDNGKRKYLYELSEFVNEGLKNNLISAKNIKSLLKEIETYKNFFDKNGIEVDHKSSIAVNNILFEETCIKLPTLFMVNTPDGTQIEVSIQKQQYASGVQPMVYFCIPLKTFANYKDIMGRPSISNDSLTYVINKGNSRVLFDLIKIFAMCSKRHNHDIKEIIKVLIKLRRGN